MVPHGPEAERNRFTSEYRHALAQSRHVTSEEIFGLIGNILEDPEYECTDPEIESVVEFVRSTLGDVNIPMSWLMEDLEDHLDDVNIKELFDSKRVKCKFIKCRKRLDRTQKRWLVGAILESLLYAMRENGFGRVKNVDLRVVQENGHYVAYFDLKFENGKGKAGGLDVCEMFERIDMV